MIQVKALNMTYKVPVRSSGVRAALSSLFSRQFQDVQAVRSIGFAVQEGEFVGFLGPNGAGKTTTMKILSGILHPTSGEAEIAGYIPWKRDYAFLRQIAVIRGSRPISIPGELTVEDALRFQKLIYQIPEHQFNSTLPELVNMLQLAPLLKRQIRGLSLGERMRAGLAWSLVYRPKVLFLDEPTLGLDVSAITLMRQFLAEYNQQFGATVLLTSHYMADVETLCKRVLIIDNGELVYDGQLANLSSTFAGFKIIKVAFEKCLPHVLWEHYGELVSSASNQVCLRVAREQVPETTRRILVDLNVLDLSVEDPPLETLMDSLYKGGLTG